MNRLFVFYIIEDLRRNRTIFSNLLTGIPKPEHSWKPASDKWCLLEVVCHLFDEEQMDFKFRMKHVLEHPGKELPKMDPLSWVKDHDYMGQDYESMLEKFLRERDASLEWLGKLGEVDWNSSWTHPKYGPLKAKMFFANWLAHDYLHIRQIMKIKHQYLQHITGEELKYAGDL